MPSEMKTYLVSAMVLFYTISNIRKVKYKFFYFGQALLGALFIYYGFFITE